MPIPDFQTLMAPLLHLSADDHEHTLAEAVDYLADRFHLTDDERNELLQSGQKRLYNRTAWAAIYLNVSRIFR